MSFLIEVTKHNYAAGSEDRLTQVVVAAFNSSARFRRKFFAFIRADYDGSAKAFSQVHADSSRPDIKILSENQWRIPIALVESKTESKSGKLQLKNHKFDQAKHHVLLLKYREPVRGKDGWTIAYWSDLALTVEQEFERITDASSFDYILFRSLVDFFREYGFMKNSVITKGHLDEAGAFLNSVRYQKSPRGSLLGIGALQEITEAMELALEMLKVDGSLTRDLKEVSSFRPSTAMNYTFQSLLRG
jgi:hypothetical protein